MPAADWAILLPQFDAEFEASPAIRKMCEEVRAARKRRMAEVQAHKFRLKFGHAAPEPSDRPAHGPVVGRDIEQHSLWQLGNRHGPLRPDVLARYVSSMNLTSAHDLEQRLRTEGASNPASLCGIHIDDAKLFEPKTVADWKSRVRPCAERHPGMCASDAGVLYSSTVAFAKSLQSRIAKVDEDSPGADHREQAGMAIYRCKAITVSALPPDAPATPDIWMMLSFYMGKPRQCAFLGLEVVDGGTGAAPKLRIPVPLALIYGHSLSLLMLRLHNGPWEIAEAKYIDVTMTEVAVQNTFSPAFCLFVTCVFLLLF